MSRWEWWETVLFYTVHRFSLSNPEVMHSSSRHHSLWLCLVVCECAYSKLEQQKVHGVLVGREQGDKQSTGRVQTYNGGGTRCLRCVQWTLQTFLSFVYRSSGVSSPLVSALTLGPSLIPEKNKKKIKTHHNLHPQHSLFQPHFPPKLSHRYLKILHRWRESQPPLSHCTPHSNCP